MKSGAATEESAGRGKEEKEKKGGRASTVDIDNIREKKLKEEQG